MTAPKDDNTPKTQSETDSSQTTNTDTTAAHVGSADLPPPHSGNPPLDFSTFCISLGTSAMVNLGSIPNPETQQSDQNLPLAKQSIDILAILKEKTKGNLSPEESRLLDNLLFDLRMSYVASCNQS